MARKVRGPLRHGLAGIGDGARGEQQHFAAVGAADDERGKANVRVEAVAWAHGRITIGNGELLGSFGCYMQLQVPMEMPGYYTATGFVLG